MSTHLPREGEVYFEHSSHGMFRRVVAIDATTGIEVTVAGPLHASSQHMERVAMQKLLRRLASGA